MPRGNHNPPANKRIWTDEMLDTLTSMYETSFNRDIANALGISYRAVFRKAKELGLQKPADFYETTTKKRAELISKALKAMPPNSGTFKKGQHAYIEGEFKKGQTRKQSAEEIKKRTAKRNETIFRDRVRLYAGLKQESKLKLNRPYVCPTRKKQETI